MHNYKLTIAYDGSNYIGWQKQSSTPLKTIQGKLEHILSLLFDEPIQVIASGRTDAGVHATGQVANFHTKHYKAPDEIKAYLAQYMSKDIAILELKVASERFHARYNCKHKTYRYKIDTGFFANPFLTRYSYHLPETLDLDAMKVASEYLIGTHDFKSFTTMKSKKKSTLKTITDINFSIEDNLMIISYRGDGFLQHMVRILTGTLIEVGLHKRKPSDIPMILEAKKRAEAGFTAPAHGLCLHFVEY